MIAGKKFYSRRVFAVHGLLLSAVLLTAYLSVGAQYAAMRDQQLQEAQTDQQLTTRVAAITLQNQFQLLMRGLAEPDGQGKVTFGPTNWIKSMALIDRSVGTPVATRPGGAAELEPIIAKAPWLAMTHDAPAFQVDNTGHLTLAVPVRDGQRVAVALLSSEQIYQDILSLTQRAGRSASSLPVTVLTSEEGQIVAGPPTTSTDGWIQSSLDANIAAKLNQMIATGNAGTELLPEGDTSFVSIQPFSIAPGVRWRVVGVRTGLRGAVADQLRPLFWQLLTQAALMIGAVVLVLLSTTVSLMRGRRRIEALRTEMLNRDLQKARRIQLNWLPAPQFDSPHVAIAAENKPALHISGDFYNWFELPRGEDDRSLKTVVVIGDVSGHGLPAAFLMATTQLLVRNTMPRLRDPGACLAEVNRQLSTLVYNGQFVTMMILVIDHDNAGLEIASAGHHAPLLRRGGHVESLPIDPQLVVGVDCSVEYQTQRFRTQPGDTFLLFTDGAIEMTNATGEQFRAERLVQAFAACGDVAREVVEGVSRALDQFRGEEEAEDDLTLLAVQVVQTDIAADEKNDAALAAGI